jgi:hypothetical protein
VRDVDADRLSSAHDVILRASAGAFATARRAKSAAVNVHPTQARNPDTTLIHHEWTWCQICQRAYPTSRWLRRRWRCPTRKCTGHIINAFPWEHPRFGPRVRHPEYPEVPVEAGWYPLW